jgi:hypothetical protein
MAILSLIPAALAVAAGGALTGYAAYRRSSRRRTHDLRPELWAELASLHAAVEALPAQIDLAKRLRKAAAHQAGSAAAEVQQWLREVDLDLSEAELLKSQLPAPDGHQSLSDMEVEIKLVEVLSSSLRARALAEKYRATISAHDTDRERVTDGTEALLQEGSYVPPGKSGPLIVESAA